MPDTAPVLASAVVVGRLSPISETIPRLPEVVGREGNCPAVVNVSYICGRSSCDARLLLCSGNPLTSVAV
jgi:hypothetical protein